jgi:hypothetical protein
LQQDEDGGPQPALPLLATPEGYGALTSALDITAGPRYAWDLYLDLAGLDLDQLRTTARRVESVAEDLRSDVVSFTFLSVQTGLDQVVRTAARRVGEARSPIYLVVFQIAAVSLAVLAGVASLTLTRQSFELAVLKSRGFTHLQLLLAQGVQSLVAAAGALPLGMLLGLGLAHLAKAAHGPFPFGGAFPIRVGATAVAVGVAGAIGGAVLVLLVSVPHVLRTVQEERRMASREGRPLLARVPFELLAGGLGAAAFWEVKRRGLEAVEGSIDPLVLLAPTLLLFTASILVLRLLLYAFRRLDGVVGRIRPLSLYLAGRRLGRSPSASFATALLLLLATGLLVVSSSYRDTLLTSHSEVALQRVGARWAVETAPAGRSLEVSSRLPEDVTAVYRGPVEGIDPESFAGGDLSQAAGATFLSTANVLGVDPETYPGRGWWRADYSGRSLDDLLASLRSPPPGFPLPPGTREIQVRMSAPESLAGFEFQAVVAGDGGRTEAVTLGAISPGEAIYRGATPNARRLLSLTVVKQEQIITPSPTEFTVSEVLAVTGDQTRSLAVRTWQALRWRGSGGSVSTTGPVLEASLIPGGGAESAGVVTDDAPLIALASRDMADLVGRSVNLTVCGTGITVQFEAALDAFPGVAGSFVVVSRDALLWRLARVSTPCGGINEVRSMGGASPAARIGASGFDVRTTRAARDVQAALGGDPRTLAVGIHFAGAAGGMGLVVIGLGVALYFGQRRRSFEIAALRALGAERSQIFGALVWEHAVLTGFALAGAVLLGYALLVLILPYAAPDLARAIPPGSLVVDWWAIAAFIGAVSVVVAVGVTLGLRSAFGSSVPSVLRGEAE